MYTEYRKLPEPNLFQRYQLYLFWAGLDLFVEKRKSQAKQLVMSDHNLGYK